MTFKAFLKTTVVFGAGAALAVVVTLAWGMGGGSRTHADHDKVAGTETAQAKQAGKDLWHCGMHPWVIQDHPGDCPVCHMKLTPMQSNSTEGSAKGEKKLLYYWDPMLGPPSISDKPGKSAMGMDLVPVYANEGGPKVTIDPTIVQNMGVRTAVVTRGPLTKTVRTVGMLKTPEPGLYDVSVKVGGWIDKLDANEEGMHILKGDRLFELYSQDLQVAEEELISAVKAGQSLAAYGAPKLKEEATSLVESAKRKLRLWDVAEEDIDAIAKAQSPPRDVPFRSPATGHIVEKMVVQGTAVQPGMKLMRIEDHTKMWLDAQVYEEQLSVVKIGQEVSAMVDAVPGKIFKGKISFMFPHVDHMTRTLAVRITLDNPSFELRPGMYATAEIVTWPLDDAIQVPREAVIDTGTRQIAFVVEGQGHFDPRLVRMGIVGDDDRVQIVEGLAPGETVVTSGQFLMDVESRTTEAIDKLRRSSSSNASPAADRDSMMVMAVPTTGQSQPSTQPTADVLSVAYCPMKKADWFQRGEGIANPYMGTMMLGCGEVTKKLKMPPAGSNLAAVVAAYLDVAEALDVDKVDTTANTALKAAADKLPGEKEYDALKQSTGKIAGAKDLKGIRSELKPLSTELISTLERSAR